MSRIVALAALVLLSAAGDAAVLSLRTVEGEARIVARDLDAGVDAGATVPACCAVQVGAVAADAAHDRVFLAANEPGGQQLVAYGYTGAATTRVAIAAGWRVVQLAYDAAGARLFALAVDASTDATTVVRVDPASGAVTALGAADPACCALRSGALLYHADRDELWTIGRRDGEAQERLLRFRATDGTRLGDDAVPAGVRLDALARDAASGFAYALAHDEAANTTRLVRIDVTGGLALVDSGSGAVACCFALAGPATIDGGALFAATREEADAALRLRRFPLAGGSVTIGAPLPATHALFRDAALTLDALLRDGFEG